MKRGVAWSMVGSVRFVFVGCEGFQKNGWNLVAGSIAVAIALSIEMLCFI